MTVKLDLHVVDKEVLEFIRDYPGKVEGALSDAVDEELVFIENVQIKAYTQSANPPKPPGSTYRRTFELQKSSKTRRTGDFSGEWYTDGRADYDLYVIGPEHDQAPIHRNRWESLEDVEKAANDAFPGIVDGHLKKVKTP